MARRVPVAARPPAATVVHATLVADPGRAMANLRRTLGLEACGGGPGAEGARRALVRVDRLQRAWASRDRAALATEAAAPHPLPGSAAEALDALAALMGADLAGGV